MVNLRLQEAYQIPCKCNVPVPLVRCTSMFTHHLSTIMCMGVINYLFYSFPVGVSRGVLNQDPEEYYIRRSIWQRYIIFVLRSTQIFLQNSIRILGSQILTPLYLVGRSQYKNHDHQGVLFEICCTSSVGAGTQISWSMCSVCSVSSVCLLNFQFPHLS